MIGMMKQFEKKPSRAVLSDEKSIKATELRLEAKINLAIERVNDVSTTNKLRIQALNKQDKKIQSLVNFPIGRHTRISSIQNHNVSRESISTSMKK